MNHERLQKSVKERVYLIAGWMCLIAGVSIIGMGIWAGFWFLGKQVTIWIIIIAVVILCMCSGGEDCLPPEYINNNPVPTYDGRCFGSGNESLNKDSDHKDSDDKE